jgi:hypothetical protein
MANWGAVETWHHGSLFSRARAWLEVRTGLCSELMLCPYCLSHWTAMLVSAVLAAGFDIAVFHDNRVVLLAPVALAITRLSNLSNDLCRRWCRTPGRHDPDVELLNDLK